MHLSVLSQPLIVLNSAKACRNLLNHKASATSDRPNLVMAGEMIGYNQAIPFMPYGQGWKEQRRVLHQTIGTSSSMQREGIVEYIEIGSRQFLRRVLQKKENDDVAGIIRK